MKGCYVYFTDQETAEYFKSRIAGGVRKSKVIAQTPAVIEKPVENVLPFERVSRKQAKPYVNAVPLVDLKFAAGAFSSAQFKDQDHDEWAIIPSRFRPREGMFVAQIVGESMNRLYSNGSWCLFKVNPQGTRNGKVVVAQHRSIEDPDTGGAYTVKRTRAPRIFEQTELGRI